MHRATKERRGRIVRNGRTLRLDGVFRRMAAEAKITNASVRVFTVPTDAPEADGTFRWDQTTMVLVEL